MDPDRFSTSVCVVMVCLLGTTRLYSAEKCSCREIPRVDSTEITEAPCFQINSKYRYQCKTGYVRKAGTSNLIRCKEQNGASQWTQPNLTCIPDPKLPPQPTHRPDLLTTFQSEGKTSTTEATITVEQRTLETENNTTLPSWTAGRSTQSTSNPHNNDNSSLRASAEHNKTVGITSSVLILLIVGTGIIFLLYKRKNSQTPTQDPGEIEPMNTPV